MADTPQPDAAADLPKPPAAGQETPQAKRPHRAFEIVFDGRGISPHTISFSDLDKTLRAFARLASGRAPEDDPKDDRKEDDKLHLVRIKSGSAIYRVSGPDRRLAKRNLGRIGATIDAPQITAENEFIIEPIRVLSSIANKFGCPLVARTPSKPDLIRIEPGLFQRAFAHQFIEGETQFVARVQRIGGASGLRCGLRVPFRSRMLICKVGGRELARRLGQLLYEDVVVKGGVTWVGSTFAVYNFRIDEVRPLKKGGVIAAFKALREAGGHAWDQIPDPKSFLEGETEEAGE